MPRFGNGNTAGTGRPRGSVNKSTVWLEELVAEGAEEVVHVVKDCARNGDMRAATFVLARVLPLRRGRPVMLDLPAVETAAGLVQAQAAVIAAMSRGELTADEAAAIGNVLEMQRRTIETHDHEHRIRGLEDREKKTEHHSSEQAP